MATRFTVYCHRHVTVFPQAAGCFHDTRYLQRRENMCREDLRGALEYSHSHVPRPVSIMDDGGLALGAQVRAKSRERDRVGLQGC